MGALGAGGASRDPGVLGEDRQPSLSCLSQPAHSLSPTTAVHRGCPRQALAMQEPEPSSCMRGTRQKFPVPRLHMALAPHASSLASPAQTSTYHPVGAITQPSAHPQPLSPTFDLATTRSKTCPTAT